MAACLPEQFIRTLDMSSPRAISRRAVSWSSGQDGGQPRSASVSPAPDKIFRTPSTWKSSPEWLAAASASSSPSSSSPARSMAVACSGLFADRGKNGTAVSPALITWRAVGGQARDRAAMPRLGEARAHDLGDHGVHAIVFRKDRHARSVPSSRGAPGSLRCYAGSGAAGEPGQRGRGRARRRRDRGAGTAGPGRRDPRRHPGAGRQARRQAVGPAHPRRREVLLRRRRAAAGDQPVHALRGPGQGPPPVLVRRRPRAGGRAPGRCRGAGPARPRRPGPRPASSAPT